MQGPSITSSQFGQPTIVPPVSQNINVVGNSSFQLPAWAKDSNSITLPDPSPPEVSSKYAQLRQVYKLVWSQLIPKSKLNSPIMMTLNSF